MKKNIFIMMFLLLANFVFSQIKIDTICIKQNDINTKIDTIYSNYSKPLINLIYLKDNIPLNGFYKVQNSDSNYFITKYKRGQEDNNNLNIIKYYKNNKLYRIDIKGRKFLGENFISILNYDCNEKKLKGSYKKLNTEKIIEHIEIKQKIRGNFVEFKVKSRTGKFKITLKN